MKITKLHLCAVLALALAAGSGLAADRPNTSDLIFTGDAGNAAAQAVAPAIDLEKIDYLLLTEKREKPFDQLHTRTMGAFQAEGQAGKTSAVEAAADLSALKVSADKAYEEFLAALAELRTLTGIEVQVSGTAALTAAAASLPATKAASVTSAASRASKSAVRVLELRALYRQRANDHARLLLAAR